jgi:hypothetical protein
MLMYTIFYATYSQYFEIAQERKVSILYPDRCINSWPKVSCNSITPREMMPSLVIRYMDGSCGLMQKLEDMAISTS